MTSAINAPIPLYGNFSGRGYGYDFKTLASVTSLSVFPANGSTITLPSYLGGGSVMVEPADGKID